jgi:hypothetical protein
MRKALHLNIEMGTQDNVVDFLMSQVAGLRNDHNV